MNWTETGVGEVLQEMTAYLPDLAQPAVFNDLSQLQTTILNHISSIFHTGHHTPFQFISRFAENIYHSNYFPSFFCSLRHVGSTLVFAHSIGTVVDVFLIIDFGYPSRDPSPRRLNTTLGLYYIQYTRCSKVTYGAPPLLSYVPQY